MFLYDVTIDYGFYILLYRHRDVDTLLAAGSAASVCKVGDLVPVLGAPINLTSGFTQYIVPEN